MADNTRLNVGSGGDLIRAVDRSGTKTSVVVLDVGGTGAEALIGNASNTLPVSLSTLPAGTNLLGKTAAGLQIASLYSGATPVSVRTAPIAATASGYTQLVAAVTAKTVYVLGFLVVSDAAVTIKFTDYDGSTNTDLTGPVPVDAKGGFAAAVTPLSVLQTGAGRALRINLSGTANVGGYVVYAQV